MPADDMHGQPWRDPFVLSGYDIGRDQVRPAFTRLLSDTLQAHLEPGQLVVEMGAGTGALRRYAGDTARWYNWIETDRQRIFLDWPQPRPGALQMAAESSQMPLRPNVADALISLAMLDTLSAPDLEATAQEVDRVLKPGGSIVHILDMQPHYMTAVKQARERGLFPLITVNPLALNFLELEGLAGRLAVTDIDPDTKALISDAAQNPGDIIPALHPSIIYKYGTIAREHGLVANTQPWLEIVSTDLAQAFQGQDFDVVSNGVVTAETLVDPLSLPHRVDAYVSKIERIQGNIRKNSDPPRKAGDQLTVLTDAHVFVAKKPRKHS